MSNKSGSELTLEELQDISFDILKDVHEFCQENDINYSLGGGSLLGAIRHQGFIPWDDDIDIFMPRQDYEKFIKIYSSKNGYRFVSPDNCYGTINTFGRVCDYKKTITHDNWTKEDVGAWIDVFPLDGVPLDPPSIYDRLFDKNRTVWRYIIKMRRSHNRLKDEKNFHCVLTTSLIKAVCVGGVVPHLAYKLSKHYQTRYAFGEVDGWALFSFSGIKKGRLVNPIETYVSRVLVPFREMEFYAMNGWKEYLTKQYGDYMQLPPVEQRVAHDSLHHVFWR